MFCETSGELRMGTLRAGALVVRSGPIGATFARELDFWRYGGLVRNNQSPDQRPGTDLVLGGNGSIPIGAACRPILTSMALALHSSHTLLRR
jgi:hypothetical protein